MARTLLRAWKLRTPSQRVLASRTRSLQEYVPGSDLISQWFMAGSYLPKRRSRRNRQSALDQFRREDRGNGPSASSAPLCGEKAAATTFAMKPHYSAAEWIGLASRLGYPPISTRDADR